MAAVYRSADCLIFPTLQDVWGLVVNEALLCGLPVISSVYAGCAAEILPAQNTFDPLTPDDFDRALRTAIRGEMAPADPGPLKTSTQVADLIWTEIQRTLAA
jgi:glycosyltransferase involved in cell wall biosynthesis